MDAYLLMFSLSRTAQRSIGSDKASCWTGPEKYTEPPAVAKEESI